jgi:uncharacterized protein YjbJ (UPF0337 family)
MREENLKRQGKGILQTLGGRVMQKIGRLFGHEPTRVEGRAAELEGRANVERGAAAERREGKLEETTGAVQRKVGEVVHSEPMVLEGRSKEIEGRNRQEINRQEPSPR